MSTARFLKDIPLFYRLSLRDCTVFMRCTYERTYPGNRVLFKEGTKGKQLFIILEGEVAIEKLPLLQGTSALSTLYLQKGDFFGELSLFEQGMRTATARTITPVTLLILDYKGLMRLKRRDKRIMGCLCENMIRLLASRIRHTNNELMVFYEVAQILSQVRSRDVLFEQTLILLLSALKSRQGGIIFKNDFTEQFELKAIRGYSREALTPDTIMQTALLKKVMSEGKGLLITDFSHQAETKALPRSGFEKKTMVIFPFAGEQKKGVIILAGKKVAGGQSDTAFTTSDLNLVSVVMRQIETVLENIRFHTEEVAQQRLQRQYIAL